MCFYQHRVMKLHRDENTAAIQEQPNKTYISVLEFLDNQDTIVCLLAYNGNDGAPIYLLYADESQDLLHEFVRVRVGDDNE